MDFDLPLFALQRTAPDRWSVLSPNAGPFLPAVCAVAVLEDPMIDLNRLHHAVHQITGSMAINFNRAAANDLREWARALHVVAAEMEAVAEIDPGEAAKGEGI
jgi:hypothetical protein